MSLLLPNLVSNRHNCLYFLILKSILVFDLAIFVRIFMMSGNGHYLSCLRIDGYLLNARSDLCLGSDQWCSMFFLTVLTRAYLESCTASILMNRF